MAAIGLGLAALDYIVQYRKVARQLRMTKEEVREEHKATEGSPVLRGAIRRRQRQIARNRMIAAVARADAVVVNPTHFAVALRYVRGQGAPKVVAKGRITWPCASAKRWPPTACRWWRTRPWPVPFTWPASSSRRSRSALRSRRPPAHVHLLSQSRRSRHSHRWGAPSRQLRCSRVAGQPDDRLPVGPSIVLLPFVPDGEVSLSPSPGWPIRR